MELAHILLSLAALSFFGATATPADVAPRADRPISLPLEAIPAGATVYGLDGQIHSNKRDNDGPFSNIAKRDEVICTGSRLCGDTTPATLDACDAASGAYDDNAWYCGYTSRVSNHCTAIFQCGKYNICWAGWFLKDSFHRIRSCSGFSHQTQCGALIFDNGNCRARYDYCTSCKNVG